LICNRVAQPIFFLLSSHGVSWFWMGILQSPVATNVSQSPRHWETEIELLSKAPWRVCRCWSVP
jgi:hypothetical protein